MVAVEFFWPGNAAATMEGLQNVSVGGEDDELMSLLRQYEVCPSPPLSSHMPGLGQVLGQGAALTG